MWIALAEFAYMGVGLMIVVGIPTCIYLALREHIYRFHFKKKFKLDSLPEHIKVRLADTEDALRNEYYIHLTGSQSPPMFDCVMYVDGWKLTTGWANDMLSIVKMLEEKGVSFADGGKNESSDISVRKPKSGVVEKPLKCLFILIVILCVIGALGTCTAYSVTMLDTIRKLAGN